MKHGACNSVLPVQGYTEIIWILVHLSPGCNPWRLGHDWRRTISAMFSKENRLQMNLPFPEMYKLPFLAQVLGQSPC